MPYYKVFRGDMTNVWDGDKNNQLPTVQYKVGEITYATKKINRKTLLPEQSEYTIYFCECALDAANWHANFGHREDVAFCEIKPRGRLGKKDPEWTIFNAYIAGQCFANGIKVIREIPKEDFAKLCMDEYRGLSQKRKDIPVRIHWLRTIGTGLFENMEFEYSLDLSAADDIKENALAGMSAEVLWLVNTRLKMGIKKLSPGMLNGVTVKCVLLLHPECVIEPGAFDNAKIGAVQFETEPCYCAGDPKIINECGAKTVSEKYYENNRQYTRNFVVDLNGNRIQSSR